MIRIIYFLAATTTNMTHKICTSDEQETKKQKEKNKLFCKWDALCFTKYAFSHLFTFFFSFCLFFAFAFAFGENETEKLTLFNERRSYFEENEIIKSTTQKITSKCIT